MISSLPFFETKQTVGRGNGEDTLAHWPSSSGIMTVEDAFLRILQYLDKVWGTISSSGSTDSQLIAFTSLYMPWIFLPFAITSLVPHLCTVFNSSYLCCVKFFSLQDT
jgi:hypothetical protein